MTKICMCECCRASRRMKAMPVPNESDLQVLAWEEEFEMEDMSKDWWQRVRIKQEVTADEVQGWLDRNVTSRYDFQQYYFHQSKGADVIFYYDKEDDPIAQADAMKFKLVFG